MIEQLIRTYRLRAEKSREGRKNVTTERMDMFLAGRATAYDTIADELESMIGICIEA